MPGPGDDGYSLTDKLMHGGGKMLAWWGNVSSRLMTLNYLNAQIRSYGQACVDYPVLTWFRRKKPVPQTSHMGSGWTPAATLLIQLPARVPGPEEKMAQVLWIHALGGDSAEAPGS